MGQLEELREENTSFKTETETKPFGIVTRITNPNRIRDNGTVLATSNDTAIFSFRSYGLTGYDVVYLELNVSGEVVSNLTETEGVLPNLFRSTDGSVWTTLTSTKIDGVKEIVVPLCDRSRLGKLKTSREFPGDLIGYFENQVMIHENDPFDSTTPDRICRLTFNKDHLYTGRKIAKLPAPGGNKVYIDSNGDLHLLRYDYEKRALIHRLVDSDNAVVKERSIATEVIHFGILNLSFEENSTMIIAEDHTMRLMEISPEGEVKNNELFEDNRGEYFYNFWGPIALGNDHYLVKYNHDKGRGWAVFNQGGLVEHFINQDNKYVNPQTGESIDPGLNDLVLGEAVGYTSGKYSLMMYESFDIHAKDKSLEIVVLTRNLNS